MERSQLKVVIRKREGVIFEGLCRALSSRNQTGPFDILPNHANFVTVINQEIVLSLKKGNKRRIEAPSGILRVKENKVEVFLGL